MRRLEFFLFGLMRDGQRLRDLLQAMLEHRGFQEAHTEALRLRHTMLDMLAMLEREEPPEAEGS